MLAVEEIRRAAGNVEAGLVGLLSFCLGQVEQITIGALDGLAAGDALPVGQAGAGCGGDIHRAGEGRGCPEALGEVEGQLHSAVAAHGQTRHECILRLVRQAEEAVHHLRQLVGDEVPVLLAVFLVAVERVVHTGHDDGQVAAGGITLHAGAALPDGVVVGIAVKQVKHLGQRFFLSSIHADALLDFRQDHVHRGLHIQCFGKIGHMQKSHRRTS